MEVLCSCEFPGNVRELESCVRRTAALAKSATIAPTDFACSDGSCLSMVLGKSASRIDPGVAGSTILPVIPPVAQCASPTCGNKHLPTNVPGNEAMPPIDPTGMEVDNDSAPERQRMIEAMEKAGWVQAKAARILGLTPRQMGYALRKHGIDIKRF
jgi:Nif-specific regulatory protein